MKDFIRHKFVINIIAIVINSRYKKNNQKTCYWVENFLTEKGYLTETFFPPRLTTYGKLRG